MTRFLPTKFRRSPSIVFRFRALDSADLFCYTETVVEKSRFVEKRLPFEYDAENLSLDSVDSVRFRLGNTRSFGFGETGVQNGPDGGSSRSRRRGERSGKTG